ncbi:MAG: Glu/Leu/Phe/Val dehydrogenase dimerization domain-containing protein [Thermoanaerobaculia bacterium]
MSFETQLAGWDGQSVVIRHDVESDTWIFIALHDDTLGTPTGGTRMRVYRRPEEGLADAQRLAAGMTAKWAAIGFPYGGGKAVLAVAAPLEGELRRGLLRRYGRLIESLRGGFVTGPDLGTSTADMEVIGIETEFVHGIPRAMPVPSGEYTAHGAYASIRAALNHAFRNPSPEGKTVLIEGLGAVGAPLARRLAHDGARLLLADIALERAQGLAQELAATVVPLEAVAATPCDVYSPCAVGGILNHRSIAQLACRIVTGAANNQLAEDADAERLFERGILYAPDFIVNAGGAIGISMSDAGKSEEEITLRLAEIGDTLGEIFTEAAALGEPPLAAAQRRVGRVLAAAREARQSA